MAKSDPRRPQDTRKESEKITRAVQAKQAAERERKDNEGCAEQSLREPSCAFRSLAAQVSESVFLSIVSLDTGVTVLKCAFNFYVGSLVP